MKNSGRRLILVTGRELPELQRAFPELTHCDLIVAENSALLYEPGTGRETVLAPAPPDAFVARLRNRRVHPLSVGKALLWKRSSDCGPARVRVVQPELQRRRHARKYCEGELGEDRSFYFRGTDGALSLRAQNLSPFLQIGAGVDDRMWLHHLRAGHYSAWIREAIKDEDLADEFAAVGRDPTLSAQDSRARIKEAVDRRYTGPVAEAPGWA